MKKILISALLSVFFLSGCLLKNDSKDVIKLTSENESIKNFTKNGKVLSLSTGINLLESGDEDGAIKFFKEYEDFYSQDYKFYYYLGRAYFDKSLYQKAAGCFEKALVLNKTQYNLYLNIAYAYENAKINNKASENFINYVFKSTDSSKNLEIKSELNKIAVPVTSKTVTGKVFLTDQADLINNSAIGLKQVFNPDTPVIFASAEIIKPAKNTKIRINWNFLKDNSEVIPVNSSEFNISNPKTILTSISNPVTGWPTGKYEMLIFVNGIKNTVINFYIF